MEEIQGLPEFTSNQNVNARIDWLNFHMLEYLQRWSGFATAEQMDVKATLANDLFYLIIAARNLINDLLKSEEISRPFPYPEWDHFNKTIEFIQDHPLKKNVRLVSETFDVYLRLASPKL